MWLKCYVLLVAADSVGSNCTFYLPSRSIMNPAQIFDNIIIAINVFLGQILHAGSSATSFVTNALGSI